MSLTDLLGESPVWERFYRYKESLAVPKRFTSELRVFTDEKRYLPVLEEIKDFKKFPLPAENTTVCSIRDCIRSDRVKPRKTR